MKQNLSYYQERNQKILQERKSGKTYREIAKKYDISVDRARQIFIKEQNKQDRINKSDNEKDFFYALLTMEKGNGYNIVIRTFNCLARSGIIQKLENDIYALDKYSDEDLLLIRNFGTKSLDITREANEIYKKWHENE